MGTTYRASFNSNVSNPTTAGSRSFIKPPSSFYVFQPRPALPSTFQNAEFDGKRLRKAVARKTVDYNTSVVKMLEARVWQRDYRDQRAIQPDLGYYTQMLPPMYMIDNPANCITTKFVRTSTNKMRCPIFCVLWTPEGRRLVTGASSGEFTLWNGLTFNFETILQAHDSAVKVMVWSHSDSWMVTADQSGYVKYWQSNMNNVKMFQAHKEPVRAISFCPTDTKFATCSDDGTVRIWDFMRCLEERILRGHGADVKGVDWHPTKALIASGSKDSQQPVKLWDPKTGQSLATLHAHKNTVTDVKWNQNGNWLLTSSRDHLIKIFDIRNMSCEMQTFRGHKREVSTLAWHPIQEGLFASGGSDGSILFWFVGTEKEIGCMEQAHDSIVWSLSWHPLGHILTSGSNDHSCKFWTRNRPGDRMRDKYNLNLLPKESDEAEFEEDSSLPIPGSVDRNNQQEEEESFVIPGFGFERTEEEISEVGTGGRPATNHHPKERKVPYSKPVPKQFQQQWNSESPNRPVNRRGDPYQQQTKYDNEHYQPPQPYGENFNYNDNQPFPNSSHMNQDFYPNQFGGSSGQHQPLPFFNGNGAPPPTFHGNIHPPPFNEFEANPPPRGDNENARGSNFFNNQVNAPIEPFGSGQGSGPPQFLPAAPLPPQMFGGNHFDMPFPPESGQTQAQPANFEYHNDQDQRQFYEQPGYPQSKRIRS